MKQPRLLGVFLFATLLSGIITGYRPYDSVDRPAENWVLRSVLDLRPRMLSIMLDKNLLVAYNTQTSSLYKAWEGTIHFDGPVYTSAHGPQPTSVGPAYMQEPDSNPWQIVANGEKPEAANVTYKGHSIVNNRVTLSYEIRYQGKTISIKESPEVIRMDSGSVGLERKFVTANIPSGVQVLVNVHLASLKGANDLKTTGKFTPGKRETEKIGNREFYTADGTLVLNSNDETVFTATFAKRPAGAGDPVKLAGEDRIFEIMAKSDCNTCHNKEKKTIGPSYLDIAKRYPNSAQQVNVLVDKIIQGGAGNWGQIPMSAHPTLSREDAGSMVSYILSLDEEQDKLAVTQKLLKPTFVPLFLPFDFAKKDVVDPMPGVAINVYRFDKPLTEFADVSKTESVFGLSANSIYSGESMAFPGSMLYQMIATLTVEKETNAVFRLISEGSARMFLDGKLVMNNTNKDLFNAKDGEMHLKAGPHALRIDYIRERGGRYSLQWKLHGSTAFVVIPPSVFTYKASHIRMKPPTIANPSKAAPGDGIPLVAVHPSFNVAQARPNDFKPKIGGMDFLSDGSLVVSTWDSLGSIYVLKNVTGTSPEAIQVKKVAYGLAEPLGIKVVNDTIYVLQKQELTRLVDRDKDGIIDEYQTICNGWRCSANFHEFAFGLLYEDGYFYVTLATAINAGGASTKPQIPDRGKLVKIAKADGSFEFISAGLRTPNGIGYGVDHEKFIADNQGDWLPANKIVHVQKGAWYGSRSVDFEGTEGKKETLPVVWLPQDDIANSPSQPVPLNIGPYQNQMIYGDITYGGIQRVFAEKVNGSYQGAVFRFSQGLEVGVNRLVWGPDGSLYAGGVGSTGNWGQTGKLNYGLQKLTYNNKLTFEMLAIRAKPTGIEIEFTKPLREGAGADASAYTIRQWYYKPTADYGGPKLDDKVLSITKVTLSNDRKRVMLELSGLQENHVVYVKLNHQSVTSTTGQKLWSTEAWYTMNSMPR